MEFIEKICTYNKDNNLSIPKECMIAIIFQNIAYTSSGNYKKWFYNTYKKNNNYIQKRERRYSLDENIDFDICLTERKISKTDSMETIYENFFLENEPIYVYYLPFPQEILPFFEKYIDYFNPNIQSKKINQGKIKYFENSNKIFISFMFDKNIELSNILFNFKIKKKIIKISKTIHDMWENIKTNPIFYNLINNLINYDEIIIISHYKNCIFTDYIIYNILQLFSINLIYCSILNPHYFPNSFYQKLDNITNFYNFGNDNKGPTKNFVEIYNNSSFICCNYTPNNYRKNLKHISIKILQNFS